MTDLGTGVDADQAARIVKSGMFDVGFYETQAGVRLSALECVKHYLREGAELGYRPNRLFDPAAYRALHGDVARAGLEPLFHYVTYGMGEGREYVAPSEFVASLAHTPASALEGRRMREQALAMGWTPERRFSPKHAVAVYASSLGCTYSQWVADQIVHGLRRAGCRIYRLDQNSRRPEEATVDVIVAPHEFFRLGAGGTWRDRVGSERGAVLNTVPLFDRWYFAALDGARDCQLVMDLSPHSAQQLRNLDVVRSAFLPVVCAQPSEASEHERGLALAQLTAVGETAWADDDRSSPEPEAWDGRPIDVLCVGALTQRRTKALARLAPTLARYRCCIWAPSSIARSGRGGSGMVGFAGCRYLARRSKVLLNLHRDDLPRFEWHRIVNMGIERGAVVVSEPGLTVPGVQEGEHYLTSDVDQMSELIDHLLGTADGQTLAAALTRRAENHLYRLFDMTMELTALTFLLDSGGAENA